MEILLEPWKMEYGIEPYEVVMIGDMLDRDTAVARSCGVRSVWLCTNQNKKELNLKTMIDDGIKADYQMAHYKQLLGILELMSLDVKHIEENNIPNCF